MDRRDLLAATGALAVAAVAGCLGDNGDDPGGGADDDDDDDQTGPSNGTDETLQVLARDNAAFGLDLYRELSAESDESLFLSPYSISVALAMTYLGAEGETASEMADVLRFDESVHEAFEEMASALDAREETEDDALGDEDPDTVDAFKLRVANALWGREGESFAEDFLDDTERYYGAGLNEADFMGDPDGERERINDWVADQTEDRIEDLLPPGSIDANTVLVLTNAIYFLASWLSEFDPEDTEEGTFERLDGTETTAPFMSQDLETPYAEVDGTQAIELPYVGGEVSMVLLLPPAGELESFEADLDAEQLFDMFDSLSAHTGMLELPRFEVETEFELATALKGLGMTRAFGSEADFGGMFEEDGGAWIDEVYHDAFVTVNEEGTEAAAATAVVMTDSAPPDWGELRFDRPFLFCIRDRPTDAVLFLGRVGDPGDVDAP